MLVMLSYTSVL